MLSAQSLLVALPLCVYLQSNMAEISNEDDEVAKLEAEQLGRTMNEQGFVIRQEEDESESESPTQLNRGIKRKLEAPLHPAPKSKSPEDLTAVFRTRLNQSLGHMPRLQPAVRVSTVLSWNWL